MGSKFGMNENIIKQIIETLAKYQEVEKATIFGSRANGTYRDASDIDIALFGESITNKINNKIYYDIDALLLPYKIDLITYSELQEENPIKHKIIKEGVEIYRAKKNNRKI